MNSSKTSSSFSSRFLLVSLGGLAQIKVTLPDALWGQGSFWIKGSGFPGTERVSDQHHVGAFRQK